MNINDLTIAQAKELAAMFSNQQSNQVASWNNGMIGKYVIVRTHDAGVHSGVLVAHNGRECVLTEGRRLWYWKIADGHKGALSGVAVYGLSPDSKVGVPVSRIHLTENCEIIATTDDSEVSIRGAKNHEG